MRMFLGWQQPLRSLADFILAEAPTPWLDLHELTVVLPSARSARRLLELLTTKASERGAALSPPQIVTAGYAPELFREATGKRAGAYARMLAWVEALGSVRKGSGKDDFAERLDLAFAMDECHTDLAVAGLSPAKAKRKMARSPVPAAPGFWDEFEKVHPVYEKLLSKWGFEDPHDARRKAIKENTLSSPGRVILAGVVEMPWALREIIHRFQDQVEVVVFAPEDRKDDFDDLGCLIPDRWQMAPDIPDDVMEFVDGPTDQAAAVLREIVRYQGQYAADEVVVGSPDQEIAPLIELRLKRAGIPVRAQVGRNLKNGAICQLLSSLVSFLRANQFDTLAGLSRHPDLTNRLSASGVEGDIPSLLDEYQSEHLIDELPDNWPGRPEDTDRLLSLTRGLDEELRALREPPTDSLPGWAKRLSQLLSCIYEDHQLNKDDPEDACALAELKAVGDALREFTALPPNGVKLEADAALTLLLRILGEEPLVEANDEPAVELLGWLELPTDDAPALILTAMNEGTVTASLSTNPILPESVRHYLGLSCDVDRFARDSYVLHALANSRKELRLIAARRSGDGHPLLPSRLLLKGSPESAGRRMLAFYGQEDRGRDARNRVEGGVSADEDVCPTLDRGHRENPLPSVGEGRRERKRTRGEGVVLSLPGDLVPGSETCSMDAPPKPDPHAPLPESMNVTSFRQYLECPYRYYLRYILDLKSKTDAAREMDAMQFGSLIHNVLQRFPRTLKGGVGSNGEILDCLMSLLKEELQRSFETLSPRIQLQAEVARRRLTAFSGWQAKWAAAGYRIAHWELDFKARDRTRWIDVDGTPMFIHGRIDRIDVRDDGNEAIVFDYKTSARSTKPEKAHYDKDRWIDLQLPLYRHLAKGAPGVTVEPKLGYIVLPSEVRKTEALIAGWTADELKSADEAAREVVRNVRKRIFGPPAELPAHYTDEFADICRSTRFLVLEEDEEDADEHDG